MVRFNEPRDENGAVNFTAVDSFKPTKETRHVLRIVPIVGSEPHRAICEAIALAPLLDRRPECIEPPRCGRAPATGIDHQIRVDITRPGGSAPNRGDTRRVGLTSRQTRDRHTPRR
jgi:hypothetical protein